MDTERSTLALAEQRRLLAVQSLDLLDHESDEVLDRLAGLATRFLSVPVALVTLIDHDRQWFAGAAGLAAFGGPEHQTALSYSLCQNVVRTAAALVVPDTTLHPDVRDNLATTELGVRAYAGVPLTTSAGDTVGAFCALDAAPREWTPDDVAALEDLAAAALAEIELRLARRSARDAQIRHEEAERLASVDQTRFALMAKVAVDGLWHWDTQTADVFTSPRYRELLGIATTDGSSTIETFLAALHPDDDQRFRDALASHLSHGTAFDLEVRVRRTDGEWRWMWDRGQAVWDADGTAVSMAGSISDVTDRRLVEAALRDRDAHYRAVLAHYPEGAVFLFDQDLRFLIADGTALRALGHDPSAMTGHALREVLPTAAANELEPFYRAALHGLEREFTTEYDGRRYAGQAVPIRNADGVVIAGMVITHDVTERERTAVALRASESRLHSVVNSAMDAVIAVDADGCIVVFNAAAERIFGLTASNAMGTPLARFLPEWFSVVGIDGRATSRRLTANADFDPATQGVRADGTTFPVEGTLSFIEQTGADGTSALTSIVILRDVTERARMESELRQAQKMEAVGRLAGGIAHDFNNLLTAIRGNAEFAQESARDVAQLDPALGSQLLADVEQIIQGADRAAGLTGQLLAFSRKQLLQPSSLDLDHVIEGIHRLLRRSIGADLDMHLDLDARSHAVIADRGQLEQVIVNLVVNARDAMPTGGRVTIQTRVEAVSALPEAAQRALSDCALAILLSVRDTGTGMSADTLANAFEPFFTTKPDGKGTGLGLSTVHGIVKQSGGTVWLESTASVGTSVWVALPAAPLSTRRKTPMQGMPAVTGHRGMIVLVEDEEGVRALGERILQRAGFVVIAFQSGDDALRWWVDRGRHEEAIAAIITDVVMPVRGGVALIEVIRRERPRIPVLFISGYVQEGVGPLELNDFTMFAPKPFTADQLLSRLHALLDASADIDACT